MLISTSKYNFCNGLRDTVIYDTKIYLKKRIRDKKNPDSSPLKLILPANSSLRAENLDLGSISIKMVSEELRGFSGWHS